MPYQRGEIIEVPFLIPHNNRFENHPMVIISNQEVYESDECYIGVMLTSSRYFDRFTFEITNDLLEKPNNKSFAQARCHLIAYILETHIISNSHQNKMHETAVDRLVDRIMVTALSEDF